MIKLKTKTNFQIPTKRGMIQGIVRLIIDKLEIDINNITASGYYYYIGENNQIIKLDTINTLQQWSVIEQTENQLLEAFNSNINLKANLFQRLSEFTFLQLAIENGKNYETLNTDWEIDGDVFNFIKQII